VQKKQIVSKLALWELYPTLISLTTERKEMKHVMEDTLGKILDARETNAVPVEFNIGDKLVFKAQTLYGREKATRIIRDKDYVGRPEVRYNGYDNFVVRWNEIVEVIPND
tara:strand:+ start:831 stop:1160 length:330 start_codon:yes stop_codon:yes gene_type:complete